MELLFLHRCLALLALWGCVTQALRRFAPRGDATFLFKFLNLPHFFPFSLLWGYFNAILCHNLPKQVMR